VDRLWLVLGEFGQLGFNVDTLMSAEELRREFPNLKPVLLRELDREVSEGVGHTGLASMVQRIGREQA
jgi:hypothetical protein